MNTIGIIAEYNPFHSGHQYHIRQSRALFPGEDTAVVVIMSGHWVQQANCAIIHKWARAKMALDGGADLVIELPSPWATSSAEGFSRGAVSLLEATGVVSALSFGSESGDIRPFQALQLAMTREKFPLLLKEALQTGCSYPTAQQWALKSMVGEAAALLEKPNNTLGLAYLSALSYYKSPIIPWTISREGAGFHEVDQPYLYTSATDIRAKLQNQQWAKTQEFLSETTQNLLRNQEYPSLSVNERGILAKIYAMTAEDWALLPDSGQDEGLPQRCVKVAQSAQSLDDFIQGVKTKRYTHARIRRLVLRAYLGINQDQVKDLPPYLRILAMNQRGRSLLQQMKSTATLPIVTKTAQIHKLSPKCQAVFHQEVVCTDLYGLCFPTVPPRGLEWTQSPVVDFSSP